MYAMLKFRSIIDDFRMLHRVFMLTLQSTLIKVNRQDLRNM
jgi:hypothetical protein